MPRAGLSRDAVVGIALAVVDDGGPAGFEGLTLAAVAARAGVAVPSLYKHVDGLPDLRREVATRAVEELGAQVRAATADRAGRAALDALAHAVRDLALRHPGRYAAVQVAPALGAEPGGRLDAASRDAVAAIAAALRASGAVVPSGATAADEGPRDDRDGPGHDADDHAGDDAGAVDAVRVVRAAVHGFVDLELRGGFGLPQDRATSFRRLLDVLAGGLGVR